METPESMDRLVIALKEVFNAGILAERMRNFDETVNRFEKRLFGNGTPGELEKQNARITSLEKMVWLINGIGIILVILIEVGSKLLK
jgi:hypothetical protein